MGQRLKNIRRMHNIMCRMNNEEAYMHWIIFVPDQPTETDLKEIAEDIDMYDDCVTLFVKLILEYGPDGIQKKI